MTVIFRNVLFIIVLLCFAWLAAHHAVPAWRLDSGFISFQTIIVFLPITVAFGVKLLPATRA
jgi:hypothetical protein